MSRPIYLPGTPNFPTDLDVRLTRVGACSFELREIALGELERIIFGMCRSSACGSDNICVRMLKFGFPAIGGVILHIINTCLIQSDKPRLMETFHSSPSVQIR